MVLESVKILEALGIGFRLIELAGAAISIEDVIKLSKERIESGEICKTIILKGKKGVNYALMLLGTDRIDFQKARKAIDEDVSIASREEVMRSTGAEPGAVCPILLKMPILVDEKVLLKEKINFGSGDHLYGLELSTRDLKKVMAFRVTDIVK